MAEYIFFIVATLPVFLIGLFIYKKDREKEPGKLLLKLGLGGILSGLSVIIFSTILMIIIPGIFEINPESISQVRLFINVLIGIALIEEVAKWIYTYKISYKSDEFGHRYDMIVYAVFVALGFAFIENLNYVYEYGLLTGAIRAITAIPGHASFGIMMGYYLGLAKQNEVLGDKKNKIKYIVLSILVPTVLHAVYDYLLFSGIPLFVILFYVFIIIIFIFVIIKINKTSKIKLNFRYKNKYCAKCGTEVLGNFCPICGEKHI